MQGCNIAMHLACIAVHLACIGATDATLQRQLIWKQTEGLVWLTRICVDLTGEFEQCSPIPCALQCSSSAPEAQCGNQSLSSM